MVGSVVRRKATTVVLMVAVVVATMLAALVLGLLGGRAAHADTTFTVDRSDDPDLATTPTAGECTEAAADDCSLRGAITAANNTSGADAINFAIPGSAGARNHLPGSPLPSHNRAGDHRRLHPARLSAEHPGRGNDAVLNVELDGTNAGDADGLVLTADASNSVVRGLVINDFDISGIFVGGDNTTIEGNFVGTDPSGTQAEDNEDDGVIIGGTGNTIGGATPEARNLVSGNDDDGVVLDPGSSDTEVLGNYIGTKRDGRTRLANDGEGVNIVGSNDNRIGGTTPAEANRSPSIPAMGYRSKNSTPMMPTATAS